MLTSSFPVCYGSGQRGLSDGHLDIRLHPWRHHDVQLDRGGGVQRLSAALLHQLHLPSSAKKVEGEARS